MGEREFYDWITRGCLHERAQSQSKICHTARLEPEVYNTITKMCKLKWWSLVFYFGVTYLSRISQYSITEDNIMNGLESLKPTTQLTKRIGNVCDSSFDVCMHQAFCKCDSLCYIFRDCCREGKPTVLQKQIQRDALEHMSKLRLPPVEGTFQAEAWFITKCPRGWTDDAIRSDCQDSDMTLYKEVINPFLVIPVTSNADFKDFRNMYCAKCHNISEFTFWNVKVHGSQITGPDDGSEWTYIETMLWYFRNSNLQISISRPDIEGGSN